MAKFAFLALIVGACGVAPGFTGEARAGSSDEFRYHYVSLKDNLPQEFIDSGAGFFPFKVTKSRVVYGTSYASLDPVNFENCYNAILEWRDGNINVLYRGTFLPRAVNEYGLFGGSVNPYTPDEQAALLQNDQLKLLKRLDGEYASYVSRVTDTGIALIESFSETAFLGTYRLYAPGRTLTIRGTEIINSEAPLPTPSPDVNNLGRMGGTAFLPGRPEDSIFYSRAFRLAPPSGRATRLAPPSGRATLLDPVAPDHYSNGLAINSRGDVLGYGPLRQSPSGHPHRRLARQQVPELLRPG